MSSPVPSELNSVQFFSAKEPKCREGLASSFPQPFPVSFIHHEQWLPSKLRESHMEPQHGVQSKPERWPGMTAALSAQLDVANCHQFWSRTGSPSQQVRCQQLPGCRRLDPGPQSSLGCVPWQLGKAWHGRSSKGESGTGLFPDLLLLRETCQWEAALGNWRPGFNVTFERCLKCFYNQIQQIIYTASNPFPKQTDTAQIVIQHIKSHSIKRVLSSFLPNSGNLNPQVKIILVEGNVDTGWSKEKTPHPTFQVYRVPSSFTVQEWAYLLERITEFEGE